jgi:hypothetical protein
VSRVTFFPPHQSENKTSGIRQSLSRSALYSGVLYLPTNIHTLEMMNSLVFSKKKVPLSTKGGTSDNATPEIGDEGDYDDRPKSPPKLSQDQREASSSGPINNIDADTGIGVEIGQVVRLNSLEDADDQEEERKQEDGGKEDSAAPSRDKEADHWFWKARLFCGKIVNNEMAQIIMIFLIIINSVMMGIGTFDFVSDNPKVDNLFETIDRSFLVIFTIEVSMQLLYLGPTLFTDGWLVFDFFIVTLSWSFESLQVVRAFRIFRAFRLFTRVKQLRDLVLAIGAVLPRMYAIGALLLLVFYIFSVLFTELFKDLPLTQNYFTTLDASLFTCMEMMTLEWGSIAREVMHFHTWAWVPFVTFITMTGFIVFNLIVAVICDAVAITEKTVRELDGIEPDTDEAKIAEAQERIDLLQCHIHGMMRTQQQIQDMIEVMAGEMLNLESERIKSEARETEMRIEIDRRLRYQQNMESQRQLEVFERRKARRNSGTSLKSATGSMSSSRHGSQRQLLDDEDSKNGSPNDSRLIVMMDYPPRSQRSGSGRRLLGGRSSSGRQLVQENSDRELGSKQGSSKRSLGSTYSDGQSS